MGRFQLELIYLYFPPSSYLINIHILDGTMVENKGKLILIDITCIILIQYVWYSLLFE